MYSESNYYMYRDYTVKMCAFKADKRCTKSSALHTRAFDISSHVLLSIIFKRFFIGI